MAQLSTGDMLREARRSGSAIGRTVAEVMDRGDLATDGIVMDIIRERLGTDDSPGGYIFAGFPRTLAQADALGGLLDDLGVRLDAVIEMQVDDDALVTRITARSTCAGCGEVYNDHTRPIPGDGRCERCGGTDFRRRADDNDESLRIRLMAYYKQTSPLIGYYHAKGLLRPVNGLGDIGGLAAGIRSVLD